MIQNKFTKLTYQLNNLINNEKINNDFSMGQIISIDDNVIQISLKKKSTLSKDTSVEINRIKGNIIKNNGKNIFVQLQNKPTFKINDSVKIHDVQKEVILRKIQDLKQDIEENKLNKSNYDTLNVLFNQFSPEFNEKTYIIKNLNRNQTLAVKKSLSANKFHIIQGPPGTGKTHTIVELIRQLYKQNKKVLITTHTHIALDNILEKLTFIPRDNILRIGVTQKIGVNARKYSLDEQIKEHDLYPEIIKRENKINSLKNIYEETFENNYEITSVTQESLLSKIFRRLTNTKNNEDSFNEIKSNRQSIGNIDKINELNVEIDKIKENIQSDLLRQVSIIASTVISSSNYLTNDIEFDYMIMDEASQVPLYLSLIPLMKTDKFILIGDDKQLQPIVNNNTTLTMNKSIFNYLIEKYPDNYTFLNIQYRMNRKIADISSNLYYSGNLKTFSEIKDRKINIDDGNFLLNNDPITCIDTSNMFYHESSNSNGCCNKYESQLILILVESLLKCNINPNEIGIITPYRKQKLYLRKLFRKKSIDVEIDTIYRFQGREKDVILISFCKSSNTSLTKFQKNFLADKNQLNVSITRARKKLIMIGDFSLLGTAENIEELLNQLFPENIIYLDDFT
ncbi:AAA domain-containing protein [Methanosphaera sp.]